MHLVVIISTLTRMILGSGSQCSRIRAIAVTVIIVGCPHVCKNAKRYSHINIVKYTNPPLIRNHCKLNSTFRLTFVHFLTPFTDWASVQCSLKSLSSADSVKYRGLWSAIEGVLVSVMYSLCQTASFPVKGGCLAGWSGRSILISLFFFFSIFMWGLHENYWATNTHLS